MTVYAIAHPGGFMKIGYSENIFSRLSGIQIGCPYRLELFALLMTHGKGEKVETAAHERLSDCHYRGEWFKVGKHTLLEVFRDLLVDYESAFHLKTPRHTLSDRA